MAIQGAAAAAKSRVDDRGRENLGAGSLFASEDGKNVNGNYSSVRVAVERRAPVGGAALAKIKSIEQKQRQAETLMFEQASEEMRVLTSVALDQLSEQLALGKMAHDMSPPRNAFVEEAVQAPAETATRVARAVPVE
ncbi:unnamed protein product, partial [Prorocentrum cordatum]